MAVELAFLIYTNNVFKDPQRCRRSKSKNKIMRAVLLVYANRIGLSKLPIYGFLSVSWLGLSRSRGIDGDDSRPSLTEAPRSTLENPRSLLVSARLTERGE